MTAELSAAAERAVVSADPPQQSPCAPAENGVGDGKGNLSSQEEVGTKPTASDAGEKERNDEVDDFGLPIRVRSQSPTSESSDERDVFHDVMEHGGSENGGASPEKPDGERKTGGGAPPNDQEVGKQLMTPEHEGGSEVLGENQLETRDELAPIESDTKEPLSQSHINGSEAHSVPAASIATNAEPLNGRQVPADGSGGADHSVAHVSHRGRDGIRPSEWSHQRLTEDKHPEDDESDGDDGWQNMPALGEFDVHDDFGRLIARGSKEDDNEAVYRSLGGAGKGYTQVQLDDDVQSATSLDEDTGYLFKEAANNSIGVEEDDDLRDPVSQLQATKDILTEGQRVAYVGVTRLALHQMVSDFQKIPSAKGTRKVLQKGTDSMMKWGQSMMARLYSHMDINPAEQTMIEQLAEHGVEPADLVRPLMENARIRNPLAEDNDPLGKSTSSAASRDLKEEDRTSVLNETDTPSTSTPPPPYEAHGEDIPEVQSPSQLPTSGEINIDLRWTVLCDLLLVLIADTTYDARSRTLLERVGKAMEVSWLQISRFEKRVIDALEMQEAADKETWDESEHMEKRRKMALKRKYMIMGLATVGGGLVIGLTGGLLGPAIGAGLAAGFTTIGVGGTSGFLGGVGGTALIASGATLTGGTVGLKASHRRTGAVQTFEYRPLHNNKRLNLVVTVGGWMSGGLDDIRLPYSTVDPIMGDLYSVLWEPEMLRSMGDTINILATEVRSHSRLRSSAEVNYSLRP